MVFTGGDQKFKINVTRTRDIRSNEQVRLKSYKRLRGPAHLDELALSRVINGVSQGRYERAAEHLQETFGIGKSSVSKKFIRASAKLLETFINRDLSKYDSVVIFIDGKFFAKNKIITAFGVTISGEKVLLGFIES